MMKYNTNPYMHFIKLIIYFIIDSVVTFCKSIHWVIDLCQCHNCKEVVFNGKSAVLIYITDD